MTLQDRRTNDIVCQNNMLREYNTENCVGAAVAYLRYCNGIYLEELQKTTKTLSQDCRCLSRDSNRDPPEYKSEALPLERT